MSDISRISVEEIYDQIFMDTKPTPNYGFGPSAVMTRAREILKEQEEGRGRNTIREFSNGRSRSVSTGRQTRSVSADGRRKAINNNSNSNSKINKSSKSSSKTRLDEIDYEDIERMRNWSGQLRR